VTDRTDDDVEMLRAAARMLTGVALRSLDVLGGSVSLPQFRALAVLDDLGPARSARVAEALGLEPSTVTRLTNRLIAAGHVTRRADPSNRSAVMLDLTDTGRRMVAEVVGWRRRELRRILLHLEAGDRDMLTKVLGRLVEAASEGQGTTVPHGPVPL
jgi:DNA-binding MarR family transcriptional regulator